MLDRPMHFQCDFARGAHPESGDDELIAILRLRRETAASHEHVLYDVDKPPLDLADWLFSTQGRLSDCTVSTELGESGTMPSRVRVSCAFDLTNDAEPPAAAADTGSGVVQ